MSHEKEKTELIMLYAWIDGGDEHSLVYTNEKIYFFEQYKTILELPARGGFPGLGIGFLAHYIREFRKIGILDEKKILLELSLEDIQALAQRTFDYGMLQKPIVIKGYDFGIIKFEYTTGGKIFKTKTQELRFPIESFDQISSYLEQYGFIPRDLDNLVHM